MRKFVIIAATTVLAGAMVLPATAADLLTVPVSDGEMAVPVADGEFAWTGFYAGLYAVSQSGSLSGGQLGLGLDFGINAQMDFVLVGGEVAVMGLDGAAGATTYVQALARGGLLASDDVLLYATAGYGADLGAAAETDLLLGAGVELAVGGDVSVRAQYLHGFPVTGANTKDQVTLGANVHF